MVCRSVLSSNFLRIVSPAPSSNSTLSGTTTAASASSFGNTLAAGVHDPEVVLRFGETLFGGQPKPAHGFGIVLEDTLAVGAHEPEVGLRNGEALFGGPAGTTARLRQRPAARPSPLAYMFPR